jgi:hypothetical protein
MSLLPVWEEIEKLSPDPATLERCYRLASKRYLKDIGFCEPFIWGKIKTSGASFYQVCWQLDPLISASNSPIYPKPDKYALALAFYYCKNTIAFTHFEEVPPWVITYVSKKPLSEAESSEKEEENQRLREKNQLKRQSEMLQGCLVLTLWIEDCLRMGLARLREQPFSYWEAIVSRLNDFKLNGIASRLLPLFYHRNEEDWIQLSIKQFGEIILFCEAFQKWDDFNPENQQDLLIYGGATIKKEVVINEPPIPDEWFVCSISYEELSIDLNARFVWLFGISSNRFAQLISYSWRGEKWENHFNLQTKFKGNIPQNVNYAVKSDYLKILTKSFSLDGKNKVNNLILKDKVKELNKGNHVRAKMSALFSELRKEVKAGNENNINVSYTPEIHKIFEVIDKSTQVMKENDTN